MFVSRDLNQISGEFAMSAFNFGWNNATVTESINIYKIIIKIVANYSYKKNRMPWLLVFEWK